MASGFSDAWIAGSTSGRRRKGVFEDIVEERRCRGDLGWVLRSRQSVPRPVVCSGGQHHHHQPSRSPAEVKRTVLQSDRLRCGLREICLDTGQPMAQLEREAEAILDEMSHSLNMFAVRSFGFAVAKVMKRLYRAVYVNSAGIAQLRKACSEYPVILMPMHRSYADFLMLSLICFDYDLPLPAIASAMDFMGMKFIGSVLRNCGAFFIRRSFATDRLYWLAFVEYVKTHVRDGLHPVEFFIEGTRSRSGKSLYPKTGMLGAILESWFMCEVPDVYLVPVSISYDRVLEEPLYAYELLGVPKPKESTSGLLKARALLSEDYGNVHFYFDEPISLRQFAEAHGGVDRGVHSLAPKVKAELTEGELGMLKAAAMRVVSRHCANAIVSPFCLVAALLLSSGVYSQHQQLSMAKLAADTLWLRRLLENLGASVDWPAEAGTAAARAVIADHCGMHADLVRVSPDACWVSLVVDKPEEPRQEPQEEARQRPQELEARAAASLRLCSYRNQLMCHLVEPALAATLAVASLEPCGLSVEAADDTLCRLLHREFPLVRPRLAAVGGGGGGRQVDDFLRACLRPFLIGCWLLCGALIGQPALLADGAASEKQLAQAAQAKAFAWLARSSEAACDCVSLDLLTNAVHGLHRLRIVRKGVRGAGHCDWEALGRLHRLLETLIGPQPRISDPVLPPSRL